MRLTIIGCTGSMSGPRAAASSYLLQAIGPDGHGGERTWSVLFDLGPGAYGNTWNFMDPAKLDAVVLSHLHADHCSDMISLQVFQRWSPRSPGRPLPVYAPAGVHHRLRQLSGDEEEDFSTDFDLREITADHNKFEIGPFKFTAAQAWHPVPAWGFRVTGPAGFPVERRRDAKVLGEPVPDPLATFVYTGDTDYCEQMVELSYRADLLLAEAGFLAKDLANLAQPPTGIHMTAEMTGRLAQNAQVRALIATHIQPWTESGDVWDEIRTNWSGPFAQAAAGAQFII